MNIFFGFLVLALFVLGNLDLSLSLVSGCRFVARGVQESLVIEGDIFIVAPFVSGSHLFAGLACCLARQWIHVYVVREGGLGPCGPPGLLCLSLCNDRFPRTLSVRSCRAYRRRPGACLLGSTRAAGHGGRHGAMLARRRRKRDHDSFRTVLFPVHFASVFTRRASSLHRDLLTFDV